MLQGDSIVRCLYFLAGLIMLYCIVHVNVYKQYHDHFVVFLTRKTRVMPSHFWIENSWWIAATLAINLYSSKKNNLCSSDNIYTYTISASYLIYVGDQRPATGFSHSSSLLVEQNINIHVKLYLCPYTNITFLKISKACLYLTVTFINPILELRILSICPTIFRAQNYLILSALIFKTP